MAEVGGGSNAHGHGVGSDVEAGVEMQEATSGRPNAAWAHCASSPSSEDQPSSVGNGRNNGELGHQNRPCCFICEEAGDLVRVCQCTDRWMHLHCQKELIRRTRSHQAGCPVCQSPYSNTRTASSPKRLTRDGWRCVAYVLGVLAVLGISTYELILYLNDQSQVAYLVVSAFFFSCITGFAVVGFLVFSKVVLVESVRIVVVSQPQPSQRCRSPIKEQERQALPPDVASMLACPAPDVGSRPHGTDVP